MQSENTIVAYASELEKATFYKKTYLHVAIAILAFIIVETILIHTVPMEWIAAMVGGKFVWLFIIGLFWLGTTLSEKMSFNPSREQQYLGLGLYVILEAIIFLPMIVIAVALTNSAELITQAAIITLFMFSGSVSYTHLTLPTKA